jgi:DNA polymerase-3 subunit delta
MSVDKIINAWKKKDFKPIYLLEGEEAYFIDQIMHFAENQILTESEASFNKTVFYGKDAEWTNVINTCKRYPMFADKQVVLLKEAQHMNSFEKLEPYIESPLSSTIFVIGFKGKTVDKRTKIYKAIAKNGEIFSSSKIQDYKIQEWISNFVHSKGLTISPKSLSLLQEHVGNDLSRIASEIEKLSINLNSKKSIDEDDIEKYIGISKEYNIFELQAAIVNKNLPAAIKIINYFEHNPKAVPIQLALPALYAFFSKVYAAFGMSVRNEWSMKPLFYNNPIAVKQANVMIESYGFSGVERLILLLNHYNLKGVGVGNSGTDDASLMKEMVAKMIIG